MLMERGGFRSAVVECKCEATHRVRVSSFKRSHPTSDLKCMNKWFSEFAAIGSASAPVGAALLQTSQISILEHYTPRGGVKFHDG